MEKSMPEAAKNFLTPVLHVGRFVMDRLRGGAWAELAETVKEPQMASITYLRTPETPEDIVA